MQPDAVLVGLRHPRHQEDYIEYHFQDLTFWIEKRLEPESIKGIALYLAPYGSDLPDREILVHLND